MKKTYIIPATAIVPVNINGTILNTSLVRDDIQTLDSSEEILTRQENAWDVWTNEEGNADYYDEYYDYEDEY